MASGQPPSPRLRGTRLDEESPSALTNTENPSRLPTIASLLSSAPDEFAVPSNIAEPGASEEPSLPRLPGVSWDEQTQSFSNNPKKRGRLPPLSSVTSVNSSDPAVFSSDDDPALDNYVEGRRKKRYVGSWFQQQPASSDSTFSEAVAQPKAKRKLARQLDSGVFLGSDGTESDVVELEMPTRPKLPQLARAAAPRLSEPERQLRERIQRQLDNGVETIDFWSMGLEELSAETLIPLSQYTRVPQVTKGVAFEQRDPELKLYLTLNRLTRLPGALFDVAHLTALSLRGNQLEEVPQAIGKLRNLQELNLSQNRLRQLPVELLDLLKVNSNLRTVVVHPNPFLKPIQRERALGMLQDDSEGYDEEELLRQHTHHGLFHHEPSNSEEPDLLDREGGSDEASVSRRPRTGLSDQPQFGCCMLSRRWGRSPVQHSTSGGRILSNFELPSQPTPEPLEVEAVFRRELMLHGRNSGCASCDIGGTGKSKIASFVPSLFETVMRNCCKSEHLGEFKGYIPEELSGLGPVFDRAVRQKESGGLNCSRCDRKIVVPELEWVEWRQVSFVRFNKENQKYLLEPLSSSEDELVVPFIHRACSRRCGPDEDDRAEGNSQG